MNRAAWLALWSLALGLGMASEGRAGAFGGGDGSSERTVRIEMTGGQTLEGSVVFQPLIVDSDLGRYEIQPEKIKTIQFLAPLDVEDDDLPPNAHRDPRGYVVAQDGYQTAMVVRGKVITTSGKEVVGAVHIPVNLKLQLEFGTITPTPEKMRTLTMVNAEPYKEKPAEAAENAKPAEASKPEKSRQEQNPRPNGPDSGSI